MEISPSEVSNSCGMDALLIQLLHAREVLKQGEEQAENLMKL